MLKIPSYGSHKTEPSLLEVPAEAAGVRRTEVSEAAVTHEGLEEGGKAPMPGQEQNKSKPPGLERQTYKGGSQNYEGGESGGGERNEEEEEEMGEQGLISKPLST